MVRYASFLVSCFFLSFLVSCTGGKKGGSQDNGEQIQSVSFKKEVRHQGVNDLDIKIIYKYKSGAGHQISDQHMLNRVDSLLDAYPNTTDWWEIVNKNLTSFLMDKYPQLDSVNSDILVTWISGAGIEYGHYNPTRCMTARTRNQKLYEYFGFQTRPVFLEKSYKDSLYPLSFNILYQYKEPIANTEYPDGLGTENTYKSLLSQYAPSCTNWTKLNDTAVNLMLKTYPEIAGINAHIKMVYKGAEKELAKAHKARHTAG